MSCRDTDCYQKIRGNITSRFIQYSSTVCTCLEYSPSGQNTEAHFNPVWLSSYYISLGSGCNTFSHGQCHHELCTTLHNGSPPVWSLHRRIKEITAVRLQMCLCRCSATSSHVSHLSTQAGCRRPRHSWEIADILLARGILKAQHTKSCTPRVGPFLGFRTPFNHVLQHQVVLGDVLL